MYFNPLCNEKMSFNVLSFFLVLSTKYFLVHSISESSPASGSSPSFWFIQYPMNQKRT